MICYLWIICYLASNNANYIRAYLVSVCRTDVASDPGFVTQASQRSGHPLYPRRQRGPTTTTIDLPTGRSHLSDCRWHVGFCMCVCMRACRLWLSQILFLGLGLLCSLSLISGDSYCEVVNFESELVELTHKLKHHPRGKHRHPHLKTHQWATLKPQWIYSNNARNTSHVHSSLSFPSEPQMTVDVLVQIFFSKQHLTEESMTRRRWDAPSQCPWQLCTSQFFFSACWEHASICRKPTMLQQIWRHAWLTCRDVQSPLERFTCMRTTHKTVQKMYLPLLSSPTYKFSVVRSFERSKGCHGCGKDRYTAWRYE